LTTFTLPDVLLAGAPASITIALRCLIIVLCLWTSIFSLTAIRLTSDRLQFCRFLGLAGVCLGLAWATETHMTEPLTIQTPFFVVFLSLSSYGSLGFLKQEKK
jgi:hypothetical protein